MKIVCPACDAGYQVPDSVVSSRRKMRCARCSTDWVPADMAAAGAEPAVTAPAPAAPSAQQTGAQSAQTDAQAGVSAIDLHGQPADSDPAELPAAAPHPSAAPAGRPAPEPASPAFKAPVLVAGTMPAPALEEHHHEDEPYQLALRPETHINVFPPSAAAAKGPAFGTSAPRIIQAARRGPPLIAWGLSIIILLAACAGAVVYRGPVMKAWPPSIRLYAALGLVQP